MALYAFTIPTEWKEYCKKSKPWCDGFYEALVKAAAKYDDAKLKNIVSEIEGSHESNAPSPTTAKHLAPTKPNSGEATTAVNEDDKPNVQPPVDERHDAKQSNDTFLIIASFCALLFIGAVAIYFFVIRPQGVSKRKQTTASSKNLGKNGSKNSKHSKSHGKQKHNMNSLTKTGSKKNASSSKHQKSKKGSSNTKNQSKKGSSKQKAIKG